MTTSPAADALAPIKEIIKPLADAKLSYPQTQFRPEVAAAINLLAAVESVEALADAWEARGIHMMEYSKTIPESVQAAIFDQGEEMVDNARKIRSALSVALNADK
jgi:hypothetical protein